MDFNPNGFLPTEDRNIPSGLSIREPTPFQRRKEALSARFRRATSSNEKNIQHNDQRKISAPNLTTLTSQSQELILRAFERIKNEDSTDVMETLDESRSLLRSSLEDFRREQDEYRQQLEELKRYKELTMKRRKENLIPISIFLRQKRDTEGLSDLHPDAGMNATYQAYFEALLTPDQNQQQHPSDKAAVIRYIRRRERRRRAEENRKNNPLSAEKLEKQTAEIIGKMDGMDIKLAKERQRQNNLLLSKMNEKKIRVQNMIETSEIIDKAHEADLARERDEQKHREKFENRLSALRQQHNQATTNMIHVQTRLNQNEDDNEASQLTDEQKSQTKNSIQLLSNNDDNRNSRMPIYGFEDSNAKIANIYI